MSKKFWIAFGCVNGTGALAAAIAVPTVLSINNQKIDVSKIVNPNNFVGYSNLDDRVLNTTYNENGFIDNATTVAKDDSNLFYAISYLATLHKISPIAHILKVLEINPNKNIFLYVNSSYANSYDFSVIDTTKYPNFRYRIIPGFDEEPYLYSTSFKLTYVNAIKEDIKANNLEGKNNKLYVPDYETFLAPFSRYPVSTKARAENLYNNYFYLSKQFKEINLIPDGTATILRFDNELYTFYKNNDLLSFNSNENKFANAIAIQQKLMTYDEIKFKDWILQDRENAVLYIATLFSAGLNQETGLPKVNIYLPYTGMLRDYNDTTSTNLNWNVEYNEYFSPFDVSGLNIIDLISGMSTETFNLLWGVFKLPSIQDLSSKFTGNTNLVYAGSLLDDVSIIDAEAKKIVSILQQQKDLTKVKLWFKPHPRETEENFQKLINKVNELANNNSTGGNNVESSPSQPSNPPSDSSDSSDSSQNTPPTSRTTIDYTTNIDFLDKTIPFEFLLMTPAFKNDESTSTLVEIYCSYSTMYFTIIASQKKDLIKKILVTQTQKNQIVADYGTPTPIDATSSKSSESICFNENIFWLI